MVELLTQKEIAYNEIKKGILDFRWNLGEKLIEEKLCKDIGVSRTPIREAFSQLANEGLVEQIPRWGAFVKKLDKKEILEIYELREALEGLAVRLAVQRATQIDLDLMEQAIKKMEKVIQKEYSKRDKIAFSKADNEFHSSLIAASHNSKLIDMTSVWHVHATDIPIIMDENDIKDRRTKLLEEHKQILRYLKEGNEQQAQQAICRHIRIAKKYAEQFFKNQKQNTP